MDRCTIQHDPYDPHDLIRSRTISHDLADLRRRLDLRKPKKSLRRAFWRGALRMLYIHRIQTRRLLCALWPKRSWPAPAIKKASLGSCDVRELGLSRWRCDDGEIRRPPDTRTAAARRAIATAACARSSTIQHDLARSCAISHDPPKIPFRSEVASHHVTRALFDIA